jgi:hypothetical protein
MYQWAYKNEFNGTAGRILHIQRYFPLNLKKYHIENVPAKNSYIYIIILEIIHLLVFYSGFQTGFCLSIQFTPVRRQGVALPIRTN